MENRFNLIDEPWIPVTDFGRVSLKEVFSNPQLRALGGNPVQKIALFKLLLAIAQSASTPQNDEEWKQMGWQGLADKCLSYLEQWHDRFYLYGDKPFLQMPGIRSLINDRTKEKLAVAKSKSKISDADNSEGLKIVGTGEYPDVWAVNNTIIFQTLSPRKLNDADMALFLVTTMNFAFGGKRVAGNITNLSGKSLGSKYSAPAGPSLGGSVGYLHCIGFGESLLESIWLNLFTTENVAERSVWLGIGKAPWEQMPINESDEFSRRYSKTYMATLISLSRFVLIQDGGVFYMDGIQYPKVTEGWIESSLIINHSSDEPKAVYVNLDKKPWRDISSWLIYSSANAMECIGLDCFMRRVKRISGVITVWVGGLKVSFKSGDQSVKKTDDFVESSFDIDTDYFGSLETERYKNEITDLGDAINDAKESVENYFYRAGDPKLTDVRKNTRAKDYASTAEKLIWILCERHTQQMIDFCFNKESSNFERVKLRKIFVDYAFQVFDQICPNSSARQMDAWAQSRPNFSKYLKAN